MSLLSVVSVFLLNLVTTSFLLNSFLLVTAALPQTGAGCQAGMLSRTKKWKMLKKLMPVRKQKKPQKYTERVRKIYSLNRLGVLQITCRLNKELSGSIFQPVPAVAAEKVHCVSSAVPQLCVHCAQYPLEGPLGDFFLLPDFIPEELSHLLINYFGFSSSLAGGGLIDE